MVLLEVVPEEVGDLKITAVLWELFEFVSCSKKIEGKVINQPDNFLKIKVVEASGEVTNSSIRGCRDGEP